MKPDELMIGDWILWKSDKPENEFPVQVTLEMMQNELKKWNDRFEYIQITPEILEKNGFELKPDGWLWHEFFGNEYQNYIFIQFRKNCEEVRYCEFKFHHKTNANWNTIQYVHELQQALRLCKIDKEIVL